MRAASLLDPSPLARSLDGWIDWDALHANVAGRLLHAVCVVATSLEPRRSRSASSRAPTPPPRSDREIHYVPHAARGRARARVGRDPAALPAGRDDRAARRDGPLRRRRDAPERADRARAGAGRRARDRRRLRAARGASARRADEPGSPRLADVAANALDGLLLDQVAARRAADARGQLVLRRAPDHGHLARRPRLPRGARAPAVPQDLLRAGRTVAAGRARRAGASRSSRALRRPARRCARPTSRCSRGCSAAAARSRAASCCRSCSSTRSSSSACCRPAAPTPSAGSPRTPASGPPTPPRSASRRRRARRGDRARRVPRAQAAVGPRSTDTPECPGSPSPGSSERSK